MLVSDATMASWLKQQAREGRDLAEQSDLFDLMTHAGDGPPTKFVLEFHCRTLVQDPRTLGVSECTRVGVGIWFHPEYQRSARPFDTVTLLGPSHLFHPNIRFPGLCIGRMAPGTPLVDLVYQIFEMLTFNKVTANDPLNPAATEWWLRHQDRFPLDARPLKWRAAGGATR